MTLEGPPPLLLRKNYKVSALRPRETFGRLGSFNALTLKSYVNIVIVEFFLSPLCGIRKIPYFSPLTADQSPFTAVSISLKPAAFIASTCSAGV